MPAKVTTRIVWQNKQELKDAKKKAQKLAYKTFSAFLRDAVDAYGNETLQYFLPAK